MSKEPTLDPIIHAPARLQLMAMLAGVSEAEFARLRDLTRVSDSVLSKHIAALVEAGYARTRKAALDGRQRTWVSLTRAGRMAFAGHVRALEAIVALAEPLAAE